METREQRIEWLKKQAFELGLKVVKSPRLEASVSREAFEDLFKAYADMDIRVTAIMRKGKIERLQVGRFLQESPETKQRRIASAKARWARAREAEANFEG